MKDVYILETKDYDGCDSSYAIIDDKQLFNWIAGVTNEAPDYIDIKNYDEENEDSVHREPLKDRFNYVDNNHSDKAIFTGYNDLHKMFHKVKKENWNVVDSLWIVFD